APLAALQDPSGSRGCYNGHRSPDLTVDSLLTASFGVQLMRSSSPGGRCLPIGLLTLALLLAVGFAAGPSRPAKPARGHWTTSRVVGSPDPPPPFKVVRAFPKLKFKHPLLLTGPPGSDRLFVGEQDGVLYSFRDRPDA